MDVSANWRRGEGAGDRCQPSHVVGAEEVIDSFSRHYLSFAFMAASERYWECHDRRPCQISVYALACGQVCTAIIPLCNLPPSHASWHTLPSKSTPHFRAIRLRSVLVAKLMSQNKKSATTRPRPENFSTMTAEEQRNWESANNVMPSSRPVHYSNVQLCVEENGPDRYVCPLLPFDPAHEQPAAIYCSAQLTISVFAARVTTSTPYFNKGKRRLEWDRYAAKLVGGPCTIAPDADRGLVRMDWPIKGDDVKMGERTSILHLTCWSPCVGDSAVLTRRTKPTLQRRQAT